MQKRTHNTSISVITTVAMFGLLCAGILKLEGNQLIEAGLIVLTCLMTGILIFNVLRLDYKNKYMDRITGINNDAWILRQGGMMYHRKLLAGYDCVFANIKDCKYINQKVSNANGDLILAEFARRLQAMLEGKGYVGRMGGDNFLVFIRDESLQELLEFFKLQEIEVVHNGVNILMKVAARCGIVKVTKSKLEDPEGYRNIINKAALALARAKKDNLDYYDFESNMMDALVKETELIERFREGLKNKEFLPYYQPQVDASTFMLCGGEALVRWRRDGNVVAPLDFIPVLEKSGAIAELDYYVFENVCADIRRWLDYGIEAVRISVNFSKVHLNESDFAEKILAIKDRYDIDSKYLEVELTESIENENTEALPSFSKKMKAAGIRLAIDDFGTGYSSLSLLKNIDADVIKLDKSFMSSIKATDEVGRGFIRDIISMIRHLGQLTLCEGVEDKEQLDFLRDCGCQIIQGFYFDKPLPRDQFETRILSPDYKRR